MLIDNCQRRLLNAASEIARLQGGQAEFPGRAMAEHEIAAARAKATDLVGKLYKTSSRLLHLHSTSLKHTCAILRTRALKVPERDEAILKLQTDVHRTRKILKESVRICMQRDAEIAKLKKDLESEQQDREALERRLQEAENWDVDDALSDYSSHTSRSRGRSLFVDAPPPRVQSAGRSVASEDERGLPYAVLQAQLHDVRRQLQERNREKVDLILEMGWLRAELDAAIVERDRWKKECAELEHLLEQTEDQLERLLGGAAPSEVLVSSPRSAGTAETHEHDANFSLSTWISKFAGMVDISASYTSPEKPSSGQTAREPPAKRLFGTSPLQLGLIRPTEQQEPEVPDLDSVKPGHEWKQSLSRRPRTGALSVSPQKPVTILSSEADHDHMTSDELAQENTRLKGMVEELRSSLHDSDEQLLKARQELKFETEPLKMRLKLTEDERDLAADKATELRERVQELEKELEDAEARLRIRTIHFNTRISDLENKLREILSNKAGADLVLGSAAFDLSESSFASAPFVLPGSFETSEQALITVQDISGISVRVAGVQQQTETSLAGSLRELSPLGPDADPKAIIEHLQSQLAVRTRLDAHRQRELDSITKELDRISMRLADMDAERRSALETCGVLERRVTDLERAATAGWTDPDDVRTWEDLRQAFLRRLEIKDRELMRVKGQVAELTRLKDEATVGMVSFDG